MASSAEENHAVKNSNDKLSTMACGFVKSVYQYFVKESTNQGFLEDPNKVYLRTSKATKIHQASVAKIMRERESEAFNGKYIFKTPGKKKSGRLGKGDISCFVIDAMRQKVYAFYFNSELPRIATLSNNIRKSGILPNYRRNSTIGEILSLNGFRFKRYSGRVVMLERNDVIIKRCQFFRNVKDVDLTTALWIGETCFKIPLFKRTADKVVKLIVFHAGTSRGFVERALLIKPSKLKGNYLNEISCNYFQKWFLKILGLVPKSTNIIVNVAPCHNAEIDKPPNLFSNRKTIIDWLNKKDIPYEEDLLKGELLDLVRMAKPILPLYLLEALAKEKGFTVIRLPPFHNHFNAIETIWQQVKEKVSKKCTSCSDWTQYSNVVKCSIEDVTQDDWSKAVDVTIQTIKKAESLEPNLESAVESVFKQIDLTKKSGREELEPVRFYDGDSNGSNDFSDTSEEGSSMDIDHGLQYAGEGSQSNLSPTAFFGVGREVTITTSASYEQNYFDEENKDLNDVSTSVNYSLSTLISTEEERLKGNPKNIEDSVLL